jgi:ParB family transcriptional regulator, chromosome partitioning protein
MAKLRGLGKGLDALLSASNMIVSVDEKQVDLNSTGLQEILLTNIKPGKYQPRQMFDETELDELANSIKHNGVIQPVVLRKNGNNYEIIAGERRYRASKLAGLKQIPAIVRDLSDVDALAISLIENIQRKDLNIIEESRGYRRLTDEFNLTHEELAKITGRSRSHISNILRLLNLHPDVQEMLMLGQLDMGHARALLPLNQSAQLALAKTVVIDKLTTAEVEQRVAKILTTSKESVQAQKKRIDPDITYLETKISNKLGMMVNIRHSKRGNGKVTLAYNSLDELDNLLSLF